jgi:phage gp29-like protein
VASNVIPFSRSQLSEDLVVDRPNVFGVRKGLYSLPPRIDDLTTNLRFDIYEEMVKDSQVQSCMGVYTTGLLAGNIDIMPVRKKGQDGYEQDVEVAEFCKEVVWNLDTPLRTHVLPDMLWAKAVGHRIAEKVYYPVEESPIPGKIVLRKVKVLPRKALYFVVDDKGNVVGLTDNTRSPDDPGRLKIFPREKFACLTWKPKDNSPLGTSDLRSAYIPWWYKQQLLPVLMKFMSLHGTPSMVSRLPAGAARRAIQNNETGTPTLDSGGSKTYNDLANVMLQKMIEFQNSSALVLPHGSEFDLVEAKSNGTIFEMVFQMMDTWIAKSILYQSPAEAFSGKASDVHQEFLGLAYAHGKAVLEHFIRTEILRDLVRYNFGENVRVPKVKVQGTDYFDFLSKASAIAKLAQTKVLHPGQYNSIFADMNLPELTDEQLSEMVEMWKTSNAPRPTETGDQHNNLS